MSFTLVPDYFFDTFDMASAEFLSEIGVKGVILDVDNTLEPYENPIPGEKVTLWLSSLARKGIKAAIVSNNSAKRIDKFNEVLALPAYSRAKKPFKRNILKAMKDMGTLKADTILMGDQVFTDAWAARNAGIRVILVPPINDKRDFFTRFKRWLEKPVMKRIDKRKNGGK